MTRVAVYALERVEGIARQRSSETQRRGCKACFQSRTGLLLEELALPRLLSHGHDLVMIHALSTMTIPVVVTRTIVQTDRKAQLIQSQLLRMAQLPVGNCIAAPWMAFETMFWICARETPLAAH